VQGDRFAVVVDRDRLLLGESGNQRDDRRNKKDREKY
jgi:hypothetical protein